MKIWTVDTAKNFIVLFVQYFEEDGTFFVIKIV